MAEVIKPEFYLTASEAFHQGDTLEKGSYFVVDEDGSLNILVVGSEGVIKWEGLDTLEDYQLKNRQEAERINQPKG